MSSVVPAGWPGGETAPRPGAIALGLPVLAATASASIVLLVGLQAREASAWSATRAMLAAVIVMVVVAAMVGEAQRRARTRASARGRWRALPLGLPTLAALSLDGSVAWAVVWTAVPAVALAWLDGAAEHRRRPLAVALVALTLIAESGLPAAPPGIGWLGPLLVVWLVGGAAAEGGPARPAPGVLRIEDLTARQLRDLGLEREAMAGSLRRHGFPPRPDFPYRPLL